MATVVVYAENDAHFSDVDSSERALVLQFTENGLVLPTIPAKIELCDTGSGGMDPSFRAR